MSSLQWTGMDVEGHKPSNVCGTKIWNCSCGKKFEKSSLINQHVKNKEHLAIRMRKQFSERKNNVDHMKAQRDSVLNRSCDVGLPSPSVNVFPSPSGVTGQSVSNSSVNVVPSQSSILPNQQKNDETSHSKASTKDKGEDSYDDVEMDIGINEDYDMVVNNAKVLQEEERLAMIEDEDYQHALKEYALLKPIEAKYELISRVGHVCTNQDLPAHVDTLQSLISDLANVCKHPGVTEKHQEQCDYLKRTIEGLVLQFKARLATPPIAPITITSTTVTTPITIPTQMTIATDPKHLALQDAAPIKKDIQQEWDQMILECADADMEESKESVISYDDDEDNDIKPIPSSTKANPIPATLATGSRGCFGESWHLVPTTVQILSKFLMAGIAVLCDYNNFANLVQVHPCVYKGELPHQALFSEASISLINNCSQWNELGKPATSRKVYQEYYRVLPPSTIAQFSKLTKIDVQKCLNGQIQPNSDADVETKPICVNFVIGFWDFMQNKNILGKSPRYCQPAIDDAPLLLFLTQHYNRYIMDKDSNIIGYQVFDKGCCIGLQSRNCDGTLEAKRGANTSKCTSCAYLLKVVRGTQVSYQKAKDHRHPHLPLDKKFYIKTIEDAYKELTALIPEDDIKKYTIQKDKVLPTIKLSAGQELSMVTTLSQLVSNGVIPKTSFLYEDLCLQIDCASKKSSRGFRYSPLMISYWTNVRFLGGTRVVNFLRGPQGAGGGQFGDRTNDPALACRYGPSCTTIKEHQPPVEVYPELCSEITAQMASMKAKNSPLVGGIAYDEISICKGLSPAYHLEQCVGLMSGWDDLKKDIVSGSLSIKDIDKPSNGLTNLRDRVATYVLQLYFISIDRKSTFPIGYVATRGADFTFLNNILQAVILKMKKAGVTVLFTCSDGHLGSDQVADVMGKLGVAHIWDYVHTTKNLRNGLLNHGFVYTAPDGTKHLIMMKDLAQLWIENPSLQMNSASFKKELFNLLKEDDIMPSDKMSWETVKNLWKAIPILKAMTGNHKAQGLALYLEKMEQYYKSFTDSSLSLKDRMAALEESTSWFIGIDQLSSNLKFQLRLTLDNFKLLISTMDKLKLPALPVLSFISTNIVENFFSVIRAKCRYPNLWNYACVYWQAYEYLLFRLSPNSGCPVAKIPLGKAYGNVEGMEFNWLTDNRTFSPAKKAAALAAVRANNHGTTEQLQLALEVCSRLRPTRKVLTIREATCKKRLSRCNIIFCEEKSCPRMFTYAGAYETHVKKYHEQIWLKKQPAITPVITPAITSVITPGSTDKTMDEPWTDGVDLDELDALELDEDEWDDVLSDWAIVFLDTETTGLDSEANIIQLAARAVLSNNECSQFEQFFKPARDVSEGAFNAHKKSTASLAEFPSFSAQVVRFNDWMRDLGTSKVLIIAHKADFDEKRMIYEYSKTVHTMPTTWRWACSKKLAHNMNLFRKLGLTACNLGYLCKRFDVVNQKPHDAVGDLNATWEMVRHLLFNKPTSDVSVAKRLLECYLCSPEWLQLPELIAKELKCPQAVPGPNTKKRAIDPNTPSKPRASPKCKNCGELMKGHKKGVCSHSAQTSLSSFLTPVPTAPVL